MVNHEILQRNENIIGKRLIQQLNYTISKGNDYITSELNGLLYLLFAPTINTLYKSFARSIIKSGSKKQIKILIDTAKKVVCNGFSIDECMDLQYNDFLHNDPILTKFKKGHKNYNWMVENTKNKFRAQLNPIVEMLKCEDEVSDYNDLGVKTFKNVKKAKEVLLEQLDIYKECIKKIQSDSSILDIPLGHDFIVKILKKGYIDNRNSINQGIEKIFRQYNNID